MSAAVERTITAVVVDDTPDIRSLLRRGLQRFGPFTVVAEAANGADGVDAVRRHRPDVVVLDLAMPVMDGLEALPLIREASPDTRVVVLSGFESSRMSGPALDRGAAAFVEKGTSIVDLVRIVGEAVGYTAEPVARRSRAEAAPTADPAVELARLHGALAVAAHELRGPSTVLSALAELYGRDVGSLTPPDVTELLETIRRQALLLDQLTTDFLVLAQAQRGRITVNRRVFRVLPVLQAVARVASSPDAVAVDCPPELTVFADEIRVQQMLGNLLSNAEKYARPPVFLTASRVGGSVEFRVSDSGDGVPPDFRPHLFDQFSRLDGQARSGTGLGLFVVRTLADAHGGQAWYEPRETGGTFAFALPAEPAVRAVG